MEGLGDTPSQEEEEDGRKVSEETRGVKCPICHARRESDGRVHRVPIVLLALYLPCLVQPSNWSGCKNVMVGGRAPPGCLLGSALHCL